MTVNNLHLVLKTEKNYTITRLGNESFTDEIISKTNENILKDYVYIKTRRIIA